MPRHRIVRLLDGDGIGLALQAEYIDATEEALDLFQSVSMAAAGAVADYGKRAFRAHIAANLGRNVSRAMGAQVYPNRRGEKSLSPAVVFEPRGRGAQKIFEAFERAETIRVKRAKYLVIPAPGVWDHVRPRTRTIDPDGKVRGGRSALFYEAERRFGPVVFNSKAGNGRNSDEHRMRVVPVKGKPFMLIVARKLRRKVGKRGGFAAPSPTALRRGNFERDVVLFYLVPQVKMPKRLHLSSVARDVANRADDIFVRAFADISKRHFPAGD